MTYPVNTVKISQLPSGTLSTGDTLAGVASAVTTQFSVAGIVLDSNFATTGIAVRTGTGTYTNRTISGTTNQIDVSNGSGVSGNPTISIDSAYAGQSSITTVGTLSVGTWQASTLVVSYGGTGLTSTTAYGILCGGTTSTGALQSMTTGNSGQLCVSKGSSTLPSWTTATYPLTATTSGSIIQANGTNWIASTATWPTAATNNKLVMGNGTNYVESTSTHPTTAGASAGMWLKSDGTNYQNSTTTYPDTGTSSKIVIGNGTNYVESTATYPATAGTTGTVLQSNGTNWINSTPTYATTYAVSTLLYASSLNTVTGLATANSSILSTSSSGVPSWGTNIPTAITIGSAYIYRVGGTVVATTDGGTGLQSYNQGDLPYASSSNTLAALAKSTSSTRVLCNTGSNNNPNWDQVSLTSGVQNTLPVGNGGTGIATATAYSVICAGTTSTGVFQSLAALGSSGYVLTSNGAGALPSFQASSATKVEVAVYCSSNQSISNNTFTKVQMNNIETDSGSYFDDSTNYRFTPGVAGKYNFSFTVTYNTPSATGSYIFITSIYKNGAAFKTNYSYSTTVTGGYISDTTTAQVAMNGSTDYIEFYTYQNSGGSLALLGGSLYVYASGALV